jgi:hypothetical protein
VSAEGYYAENYAESVMPLESTCEDPDSPVGDAVTWWGYWQSIRDAYEAGWNQAMKQAREKLWDEYDL